MNRADHEHLVLTAEHLRALHWAVSAALAVFLAVDLLVLSKLVVTSFEGGWSAVHDWMLHLTAEGQDRFAGDLSPVAYRHFGLLLAGLVVGTGAGIFAAFRISRARGVN